jgi:hypothetical protein
MHRWSRRFSPLRRVNFSLPVLATGQTLNSSSLRVDREYCCGLLVLLLVVIDWYVLSTELITDSNKVDYMIVVLVLASSHCNFYYWVDKLSMVNWNELLNQIHICCPYVY